MPPPTQETSIPPRSPFALFRPLFVENEVLRSLLGLCPLLAVSTNFAAALMLGVCTLLVMQVTVLWVNLTRKIYEESTRLLMFVLFIASATVSLDTLLKLWAYPLERQVGIFLPLIITNCLIMAAAEFSQKSQKSLLSDLNHHFKIGGGFLSLLLILGALRELLGSGTLFSQLELLFPLPHAVTLHSLLPQFPLFALPSGAFFLLSFLILLQRWLARPQIQPSASSR